MFYMAVVKRVNPKCFHYKANIASFILNPYEMMNVHQTHRGNLFMVQRDY